MTHRPVVVLGDVGVDVIARPSGPVVAGGDTPSSVSTTPGGAGANSAAWLAAYGCDVALLGRVGADAAGAAARVALEAGGVRCAFSVDPERPTCTVVVIVDTAGERTMLSDRGASGGLQASDVDLTAVHGPATTLLRPHLHLSGFVLLAETSRAAGRAALRQAAELGWSTSVDPQAANLVAAYGSSAFLDLVRGVEILLPNAAEAVALGGVAAILGAAGEVVVTHGAGRAEWVTRESRVTAVIPDTDCIDTTGCGDAFNAGLLSAWLADATRAEALRTGVEAGSRCAARVGGRP